MAQIQISSEDVMAYSKQVDTYANEIRTVFNEIESRMYYVESIWQSPAFEILYGTISNVESKE